MNRAVFLDRDGTINIDKAYVYKKEDFIYLDGVKEGLKALSDAGFLLIVITNQSGIGRGYYTLEEYRELEAWLFEDLRADGIELTASYFCPHHKDAKLTEYKKECSCRKPLTGMYEQAAADYDIDIKNSFVIGDRLRDLTPCNLGAAGFLLYADASEYADCDTDVKLDKNKVHFVNGGLKEAADVILSGMK